MTVGIEVEVGVEMDAVLSVHPATGDAGDDAGDVGVTVWQVFELFAVSGRQEQREHGAVGEDRAGTASCTSRTVYATSMGAWKNIRLLAEANFHSEFRTLRWTGSYYEIRPDE